MKLKVDKNGILWYPRGIKFVLKRECFEREDIKKIVFPDDVHIIGEEAFEGCSNLQEVVFSSSSECHIIGKNSFSNCVNLKKIRFPKNLFLIDVGAFENCFSLSEVRFPNSLQKIEKDSFLNCVNLKEIFFLGGEKITFHKMAFRKCRNLILFHARKEDYISHISFDQQIFFVKTFMKFRGFVFARICLVDFLENGKPFGKIIHFCIGPHGRQGEGVRVKDAYKDWLFWQNFDEKRESLVDNLTMESIIGVEEFRVISGACSLGTLEFCKKIKMSMNFKMPLFEAKKKILQYKKFLKRSNTFFDSFLNFCEAIEQKQKTR